MSEDLTTDSRSAKNEDNEIVEVSPPLGKSKKADSQSSVIVRVEDPEDVQAWKTISSELRRETVRTENTTRQWLAYSIIFVFVLWSVSGGIYLMFFNGNTQVLITGSAFISGPLGVVIGYYFGVGDDRKKR